MVPTRETTSKQALKHGEPRESRASERLDRRWLRGSVHHQGASLVNTSMAMNKTAIT